MMPRRKGGRDEDPARAFDESAPSPPPLGVAGVRIDLRSAHSKATIGMPVSGKSEPLASSFSPDTWANA